MNSPRPEGLAPELAEVLPQWRNITPCHADDNWVFASPYTHGERPLLARLRDG